MDNFHIETAQNVTIQQNVANLSTRIGAFFIDAFIIGGYYLIIYLILDSLNLISGDLYLIYGLLSLPVFFYSLLFETLMNGQSPGKYLNKIRVTKLDGSKPTFSNYLIRWMLRSIDITMASGSLALLTILLNGKGQRLGDLAAGTTVISEKKIIEFFKKDFPDTLSLIPDILKEFENNPTGKLGTIKCYPWAYKGNTLLLGDSSHAIVPFYGQGMNASFEDVYVLDAVLNQFEGNWSTVFSEFQKQRKIDTDAIADLAIDNYFEMRDHVANPSFKEKRMIEMNLEKFFPTQYFSKYSLVTFNENIGYHEAMTKGRAQDKVLLKMIENSLYTSSSYESEELMHNILEKVQEETNKLLK